MSIAFLDAIKNLSDEKLEEALSAMCEIAVEPSQKKTAVLKLIAKCREMPEAAPSPASNKV